MNATTLESKSLLETRPATAEATTDPLRFSMSVALVVFATYFFTTTRLNENLQAESL